MVRIFGILNVTRDSFSDGGSSLDPASVLARARALVEAGADVVDVGAESTHPDSESVPADEEIRRIAPVVESLAADGVPVSVDTWKPEVLRRAVELGASYVNDVRALRTPGAVEAVRDSDARIVLMHSISPEARARRPSSDGGLAPSDGGLTPGRVMDAILRFFEERLATLEEAGVARERLILDPGMGFFLGDDPRPSLEVLAQLPRLHDLGRPVLVSTSRKSFLGAVCDRPVEGRGPATLATEILAWQRGVDFLRTHDVGALADALRVLRAIEDAGRQD